LILTLHRKEDVVMPLKKLKDFLDGHNIKYVTISHSQAFTAQETAATAHIPGKELAKTVMVKIDGKMAMAVLPASYKIDFNLLKEATGAKRVELASEQEFKDLFPECEIGAMPPFGNLYGMEVFATESLAENQDIAFNSGSHTELIKMSYKDFETHVKPTVMKFSSEQQSQI
jgi:Ala-tRNA(Pro) deacylase